MAVRRIKVWEKTLLEDGKYVIKGIQDLDTGQDIDSPSLIMNLLRIREKLLPEVKGFEYTFPFAFAPSRYVTSGFGLDFPVIFNVYEDE